jgi:hypothetical protein
MVDLFCEMTYTNLHDLYYSGQGMGRIRLNDPPGVEKVQPLSPRGVGVMTV